MNKVINNFAARVVSCVRKYEHITPRLKRLHWLPVNGLVPDYLCHLLQQYKPSRCLRSEDKLMLCVPKIRNKMDERIFNYFDHVIWNKLPIKSREQTSLNKLSKLPKTNYFDLAFN